MRSAHDGNMMNAVCFHHVERFLGRLASLDLHRKMSHVLSNFLRVTFHGSSVALLGGNRHPRIGSLKQL